MPTIADIEGVGRVEVPDDITDAELTDITARLSKGRVRSAAATVAREPGRMAGQSLSGLARFGQAFGDSFGTPGGESGMSFQEPQSNPLTESQRPGPQRAEELARNELYQTGQNITSGAEKVFQPNPLYANKFETAVASGVGSVIGLLPSAVAGPAAPLVAGLHYGLSQGESMAEEAGQIIDERVASARIAGDTTTAAQLERDKFQMQTATFLANAAVGAATEGGVGVAGRLVGMATGKQTAIGALARKITSSAIERPIAKGVVEGVIREGAQETTEQLAQNLAARLIYDPNQSLTEGVGMSGGAGAVVGGLFGGSAGALNRRRTAALKPTPEQRAVAPEAADAVDQMTEALNQGDAVAPPKTDEDAVTAPLTPAQQTTEALKSGNAVLAAAEPEAASQPAPVVTQEPSQPAPAQPTSEEQTALNLELLATQPDEPNPAKRARPKSKFEEQRPLDILDEIQAAVGKIDPKLIQEADPNWKPKGRLREFFKRGGIPADVALDTLVRNKGLGARLDATNYDDLVKAMETAATQRTTARTEFKGAEAALDVQAEQVQAFEKDVLKGKRKNAVQVPVDSLIDGDKFEVKGHKFEVTDVNFDEDGQLLSVTVNDGDKFGVQQIGPEQTDVIHVDEKTFKPAKMTEFAPEPVEQTAPASFFDKPESVEEQKAREATLAAQKTKTAEQAKIADLQAAPLTGTQGDIGQAGLFEDPSDDMFAGPSAETQAKKKSTADRIDAALTKAIDATNPTDKLFDFVAGVPTAAAHAMLRVARALFRAGRTVAEAIAEAIRQHREANPTAKFDDAELTAKLQDAITAGTEVFPPDAAPGAKAQESRGVFTGPITKDSDKQWKAAADEWMNQFGEDLQTAFEKATAPNVPIDPALRQYVLIEVVSRTNDRLKGQKNPVQMMADLRLQEAAANTLRDSGAQEFGKVGAARQLAFKRIEGIMPVLAFRNLVRAAQARLPFPDVTSENVKKWLKQAGDRAVAEVREAMTKVNNVVARELKRGVQDLSATWREILTSSIAVQGDFRRALYDAVLKHPTLKGISPEGATEIVNLLADEWERQRLKIFRSEFKKEVPNLSEKNAKKIIEALPDIVIQSNLGLLDDATFRNAVAPRYGVATFDGPTAQTVNKLAQAAQAAPSGVVRNRILDQIMSAIRRSDTVRFKDVFRDYWYAAMLSGIRTQVDNGLSILNGTINVGMAMARNPKGSGLVGGAYLRGLAQAAEDVVPILKGERWRMHNIDVERPSSSLEALLASKNPVAKVLGSAAFVSRLIGALDHLNALSTREAMKAWAMYRLSPAEARASLAVSEAELSDARERAIQEGTPKTLLNSRVREILEEKIPVEVVLSATDLGRQVSFQNVPYGMLGHFYRFLTTLDKTPILGGFTRIISGTAFARYAVNYSNDILNYVAPIAAFRWYNSSPTNTSKNRLDFSPEARELLLAKAVFGTLAATIAAAVFLGDDDEEKKRAIDITGSFRGLSPAQRNQLLSEGRQPYSIRFGDTYVSYRQLPVAGVLSSVGELRDRQLFDKKNFDQDSVASKIANAGLAGMLIVRDSSAIVGLVDMLGFAQAYKYNTETVLDKDIPKFAARMLGSLIPNIAKEVDAWTDPGLYRANSGWEYFMQQVPWVRRDIPPGPALNVLGEKIAVERLPWSRWIKARSEDPEWKTLGTLASRGVFMPIAGHFTLEDDDGKRRDPTPTEMRKYQLTTGEAYREYLKEDGAYLLTLPPEEARQEIDKQTTKIRSRARKDLVE